MMPAAPRSERLAGPQPCFRYEAVFSIFLLVLAFLFRHQTNIVYPKLSMVLASFLAFNFLFNRFLKQDRSSVWLIAASLVVNSILITWAVYYSGREESYLWVMYMLPIFTASLVFRPVGVWMVMMGVTILHGAVYGEDIRLLTRWEWLTFLSRTALLCFSAAAIMRLAVSERRSRYKARLRRLCVEKMLKQTTKFEMKSSGNSIIGVAVHDLNNLLMGILGSAQLLRMDAPPDWNGEGDVAQIESNVRVSTMLLQNLALLGGTEWPLSLYPLEPVLEEAVQNIRSVARERNIATRTQLTGVQNVGRISPTLIRQAFSNLLVFVCHSTQPGKEIVVTTKTSEKENGAFLLQVTMGSGGSLYDWEAFSKVFETHQCLSGLPRGVKVGLLLSREIIFRHGGDLTPLLLEGGNMGFGVSLPLADTVGDRAGSVGVLEKVKLYVNGQSPPCRTSPSSAITAASGSAL